MTGKRFTLAYSDDTEKSKWWAVRDGDITLWKEEVVYLLNQLHEENEQLKHDATVLICSNQEYRKENEQLKSQLHCDDENGVCNICKHHYLVKNNESEFGYYNSRCKKEHYECARISLKHCEDFELRSDVE